MAKQAPFEILAIFKSEDSAEEAFLAII